jgi:hypothetical protein
MFRRFQFSLLSLLILLSACSAGFVLVGREIRHKHAIKRLEQLGGHVSYGSKARIVYLWRHEHDAGFGFQYVMEETEVIRCLHQLKPFTHIRLIENQRHMEAALHREFPEVLIERIAAGII